MRMILIVCLWIIGKCNIFEVSLKAIYPLCCTSGLSIIAAVFLFRRMQTLPASTDADSAERPSYPYKWVPETNQEVVELWKRCFDSESRFSDLVMSEPGRIVLPRSFLPVAEQIYNMEVRPDDIWITTFPKSGTTWIQVSKGILNHVSP